MIERLERAYGIKIVDDSFYSPLHRRFVKCYRIYTADGCPWENGLTYKGLLAEVKRYREEFLSIKRYVEALKERGMA